MGPRILVVDDDQPIADSLCTILKLAGYESLATYSALEGLDALSTFQPHLILADVIMPEKNGVELAMELQSRCPHLPILFLSGNAATEEVLTNARTDMSHI